MCRRFDKRDHEQVTTTEGSTATSPQPRAGQTRPAPAAYLSWLRDEVADWRARGLVDDQQAAAILGGYHPTRRLSLARLLLALGAVFVGFGVIWLIASNLDELPPLLRFLVVVALWIAATVGAEVLATTRAHGGSIPSPVVHGMRLLAALLFGGVVFQAAQSLQVQAYEPSLLAFWSAGALAHAYAVRGAGPLVVGVLTGYGWAIWQSGYSYENALAALVVIGAAAVVGVALAALHSLGNPATSKSGQTSAWAGFAPVWREFAAIALLGVLFTAALPFVTADDFAWRAGIVLAVVLAGVATAAAVAAGRRPGAPRWLWAEPLGAVGVAALAVVLVAWDAGSDPDRIGVGDWAHATVSVVCYLVVATAVAVVGILRDSTRLTFVAVAALALFTTVQAFAVFAQIIQGAWLFLIVGLILAGTGWVADRGRRQLAASLDDEATGADR